MIGSCQSITESPKPALEEPSETVSHSAADGHLIPWLHFRNGAQRAVCHQHRRRTLEALVDDHRAEPRGEVCQRELLTAERLLERQRDPGPDPALARADNTDLPRMDAELALDATQPLLHQRAPRHDHKRWLTHLDDRREGHRRLPAPRRSPDDSLLLGEACREGVLLVPPEPDAVLRKVDGLQPDPAVAEHRSDPRVGQDLLDPSRTASRQTQHATRAAPGLDASRHPVERLAEAPPLHALGVRVIELLLQRGPDAGGQPLFSDPHTMVDHHLDRLLRHPTPPSDLEIL